MADQTPIEWTDYTFNPWIGCTKVAAGCEHCYAEADMDHRRHRVKWGPHGTRSKTSRAYWQKPILWNLHAAGGLCFTCGQWATDGSPDCECGQYGATGYTRRPRVFCASLADVFEAWDGPLVNHLGEQLWSTSPPGVKPVTMDDLRAELFALIDRTPNLDWILLTKRPENIRRMWPTENDGHGGRLAAAIFAPPGREFDPPPGQLVRRRNNVWLVTSVATQADADRDIPQLLECRDLAPVLGVSAEPLIEPIDLRLEDSTDLDWVITGGESGPAARESLLEWHDDLRLQCQAAGVASFTKQLGSHVIAGNANLWGDWLDERELLPCELRHGCASTRVKLRHPKGGDPAEWPEQLRVREFPTPRTHRTLA